MAITWKQIDKNGNGYVDGTEAQKAKEKGVKNVWNNMTQSDYENGITVDQKYVSIKNETVNIARKYKYLLDENSILVNNLNISNNDVQNEVFGTYRKLEQLRYKLEKMQKDFDNEFNDLEGAWYTLKYGTEDLINKFGSSDKEVIEYGTLTHRHEDLIKFDKDERVHKYFSYKTEISSLKHQLRDLEQELCKKFT